MPYTIGERRIKVSPDLAEEDQILLLQNSKIFKYCLNNAVLKYLINLKTVVHLYSDVLTIYSTLLKKIPQYEDITNMTNDCKNNILQLESDFNDIFGKDTLQESDFDNDGVNSSTSINFRQIEFQSYEQNIRPSVKLILQSTLSTFEFVNKTLHCIEVFFTSFSNLKKLLVPFLKLQTSSILRSLRSAEELFQKSLIVDNIPHSFDPLVWQQLMDIERITSNIERESVTLNTAFCTFEASLVHYTNLLLGKAILKRTIEERDCYLIRRREVCYQASEHVVSIPLTEEKTSNDNPMMSFGTALTYIVMFLVGLVALVLYRLIRVITGS
ncbi:membrane-localized protein [Candida orthopsilosis Co 90-125]|uniref:Membrane-localized protein n=1 Tax=Candida orthopsilosis (strain 90-125) TaxID=1136231 RepID=H8X167_CANO9|nr:membrane-localized protein [Candida orthopsilosis Co 90-125]CCG22107.1 membrane-localized protein [Candida orthopsilosis Co 90-125]